MTKSKATGSDLTLAASRVRCLISFLGLGVSCGARFSLCPPISKEMPGFRGARTPKLKRMGVHETKPRRDGPRGPLWAALIRRVSKRARLLAHCGPLRRDLSSRYKGFGTQGRQRLIRGGPNFGNAGTVDDRAQNILQQRHLRVRKHLLTIMR